MGKYLILNSHVNEEICLMLGIKYERTSSGIVIEISEEDKKYLIERIANYLLDTHRAHDYGYAIQLASSFFLNKIE